MDRILVVKLYQAVRQFRHGHIFAGLGWREATSKANENTGEYQNKNSLFHAAVPRCPWSVYRLGVPGGKERGPPCKKAEAAVAEFKLDNVAKEGIANIGNWPETLRPNAIACCIPSACKSDLRTFASLDDTASTITRSSTTCTSGLEGLNPPACRDPR